jgi:hypothetical protein
MTDAAPAPVLVGTDRATWARDVLADQGMPRDEIVAVLTAERETIHRYMELHAERLQELLAAQLSVLTEVERVMIDAAPLRSRVA